MGRKQPSERYLSCKTIAGEGCCHEEVYRVFRPSEFDGGRAEDASEGDMEKGRAKGDDPAESNPLPAAGQSIGRVHHDAFGRAWDSGSEYAGATGCGAASGVWTRRVDR